MKSIVFSDLISFTHQAVHAAITNCFASNSSCRLLAIDGTCGNGHDTLFLCKSLQSLNANNGFHILAFDVQQKALEVTTELLRKQGRFDSVKLLLKNHASAGEELLRYKQEIGVPSALCVVMYNLGFLPRSDKQVVTSKADTLASLRSTLPLLADEGILTVHAYGGHPGGKDEMDAVDDWCAALPHAEWQCVRYSIHNKPKAPEALFLIRKKIAHAENR